MSLHVMSSYIQILILKLSHRGERERLEYALARKASPVPFPQAPGLLTLLYLCSVRCTMTASFPSIGCGGILPLVLRA